MMKLWALSEFDVILQGTSNIITSIHIENVDQYDQLPSQIMEELVSKYRIPENKQVHNFVKKY